LHSDKNTGWLSRKLLGVIDYDDNDDDDDEGDGDDDEEER
jgi:hypothetical protein